jgi:hypothetical protein
MNHSLTRAFTACLATFTMVIVTACDDSALDKPLFDNPVTKPLERIDDMQNDAISCRESPGQLNGSTQGYLNDEQQCVKSRQRANEYRSGERVVTDCTEALLAAQTDDERAAVMASAGCATDNQ